MNRVPWRESNGYATVTDVPVPIIDCAKDRRQPMLSHDLRRDDGILVLKPDGPLEAADFETLAAHVDAYLEQNGTLHGVMVQAKSFPGWKDFSALLAHLKFVK